MPKGFKPTQTGTSKLDDLVKSGVPSHNKETKQTDSASNSPSEPSSTSKQERKSRQKVERVTNGYSVKKENFDKVRILAALTGKKQYELVDEALELLFENHKDTLAKFS